MDLEKWMADKNRDTILLYAHIAALWLIVIFLAIFN